MERTQLEELLRQDLRQRQEQVFQERSTNSLNRRSSSSRRLNRSSPTSTHNVQAVVDSSNNQQQPSLTRLPSISALHQPSLDYPQVIFGLDYQFSLSGLPPPLSSESDLDHPPSMDQSFLRDLSLTRRILSAASSYDQNRNHSRSYEDWRHAFFERMNQDFHLGLARSPSNNTLRQRLDEAPLSPPFSTDNNINNYTTPPSPDYLRRSSTTTDHYQQLLAPKDSVFNQNLRHTYLLYCGHNSQATDILDQSIESLPKQAGCGKLITIRAAAFPPRQIGQSMTDRTPQSITRSFCFREEVLIASDSLPFPDSVDQLDPSTQESFETDPSNPLRDLDATSVPCTCQKTYLGCLTCGNIVGHSISYAQRRCRVHDYSHYYYLNRVTALKRHANTPIPLTLDDFKPPSSSPTNYWMTWTEALRNKKQDVESRYVGSLGSLIPPIMSLPCQRNPVLNPTPLSATIRNAIMLGAIDQTFELAGMTGAARSSSSSSAYPRSLHRSSQANPQPVHRDPSSSSLRCRTRSSAHTRTRRSSMLNRRPAIRVSSQRALASNSRSPLRSDSWAIYDAETESLTLRQVSRDSTDRFSPWYDSQSGQLENDQIEIKEEEDTETVQRSTRRQRSEDDDEDQDFDDLADENGQRSSWSRRRMIRRRINLEGAQHSSADRAYHPSARFSWSSDVCAR